MPSHCSPIFRGRGGGGALPHNFNFERRGGGGGGGIMYTIPRIFK